MRYEAKDVLVDTLASTPFSSAVEDTGMQLYCIVLSCLVVVSVIVLFDASAVSL